MNLTQVIMAEMYNCQKSSTQKQKGMPDIIKIFRLHILIKKRTKLFF